MAHTTSPPDLAPAGVDAGRLRPGFDGEILTAADGRRYDDARVVFNAMFDRRPGVIARATSESDVVTALRFAQQAGLTVAVRGGGHSVAGYSAIDGGLLLDLRPMQGIQVDPERRRVLVQPGVTWGELDRATQEHGLATTGGRMTTTGVSGFTLGSGSGWLERLHGLACDNLLSARVVTADGRVLRASATEHADLFWGLRGGGGNFGVVTEFELRLHPVGPVVYGGVMIHPRDRAPEVCRALRDLMRDAPRELAAGVILMHAPPAPFVPSELQGRPAVAVMAAYFGSVDEGAQVLAPLRALGGAPVDIIGPLSYVQLQALTDPGNPPGRRNYWHSDLLDDLPDDAIDALVACAATATSTASVVILSPLGGAVADVPEEATPIGGRSARWYYHCYAIWTDEDDHRHVEWARATGRVMRPWTRAGMALNFYTDVDDARIRSAFGAEKYRRLVALKDEYDPGNHFRLNQNISPSGSRPDRA
jgi:FAD/FMN-containing dehydrogenase